MVGLVRKWKEACVLALFFAPQACLAAPFCVAVQGLSPQCYYYDARDCQARAIQESGVCVINQDELKLEPGNGQFCMVQSDRSSQCVYSDRPSCEIEAARKGAVCIDNVASLGSQEDPYRNDPHRNY